MHRKDPLMLTHVEFGWQLSIDNEHSSMSVNIKQTIGYVKAERFCFKIRKFYYFLFIELENMHEASPRHFRTM